MAVSMNYFWAFFGSGCDTYRSHAGYYEQYFKDYAYRHVPVALGTNEETRVGFSFSIEEVWLFACISPISNHIKFA